MISLKKIQLKKIINQTNIFIFFLILNFLILSNIKCQISNLIPQNKIQISNPNQSYQTDFNKLNQTIDNIKISFDKIQSDVNKVFVSFTEIIELNKKLDKKIEIQIKNLQNEYIDTYDKNSKEFYDEFERITGIKNVGIINDEKQK